MKFIYVLLAFLPLFVSCESTTNTSEQEQADSTQNSRGLLEETSELPDDIADEPAGLMEQLYGTWKLTDIKMGVQPLAMADDEESFIEFTEDGTMVLTTGDMEPSSEPFTINEQSISTDLYDNPQLVKSITANELILVDKVDGVDIDYIYERIK